MYLGKYTDIRRTLDREFPGKEAYTDDNEIVFGAEEDQCTRATIQVPKAGVWEITIYKGPELDDIAEVRTVRVPSARPDPPRRRKAPKDDVIQPYPGTDGRYYVTLRDTDGKTHIRAVADLVAEAFIGPCPDGHEVRFKNGDKTDSRPGNLYYAPIRLN
jgi:HNH endonuclease